jgi:hypothetical protein
MSSHVTFRVLHARRCPWLGGVGIVDSWPLGQTRTHLLWGSRGSRLVAERHRLNEGLAPSQEMREWLARAVSLQSPAAFRACPGLGRWKWKVSAEARQGSRLRQGLLVILETAARPQTCPFAPRPAQAGVSSKRTNERLLVVAVGTPRFLCDLPLWSLLELELCIAIEWHLDFFFFIFILSLFFRRDDVDERTRQLRTLP